MTTKTSTIIVHNADLYIDCGSYRLNSSVSNVRADGFNDVGIDPISELAASIARAIIASADLSHSVNIDCGAMTANTVVSANGVILAARIRIAWNGDFMKAATLRASSKVGAIHFDSVELPSEAAAVFVED